MELSYKYRAKLSKSNEKKLLGWLQPAMELYNELNTICLDRWDKREKVPGKYDLCEWIKQPQYRIVHSQVRQQIAERVALAWKAFFRKLKLAKKKGFVKLPKNKASVDKYRSFTFPQREISFSIKDTGLVHLSGIGLVKFKEHRPYRGDVKRVTIKRSPTGKWYIILACEKVPTTKQPLTGLMVGIDMNKGDNLLTLSDGTKYDRVKIKDKGSWKRIKVLDRKIYRAKDNLVRRTKLLRKKAHVEERISNRRNNYLNQVANSLIRKYDILVLENLDIEGMLDNDREGHPVKVANENKNTLDCGWFLLRNMLEYKAIMAGKKTVSIDPKNTSKTCSRCGAIKEDLQLSDRTYCCSHCGLEVDRDLNASLNILRLGHESLKKTTVHSAASS